MSDKKEIKLYSTAFLMSIAVHALVLLLIIIFSKASLNAQKMVVIDLTLMDPVTSGVAVASDKKANTMSKLKTKHKKAAVKHVEPEKREKIQDAKEEKTETELKVIQHLETPQLDEHIPAVKTVLLVQDTEKSIMSEDQEGNEHAGTFLAHTKETAERSLAEEGESIKRIKESFSGVTEVKGVLGGYLKSHLSYIKDIIQKNITYPETARRNGWMGKVKVSFVIANNGRVNDIKVIQSSGVRILDKSAKEAVSRSSPFPHPPVEARIIIPILFTLH